MPNSDLFRGLALDLGYSAEDVQRALNRANGDADQACSLLLDGGLRRRCATRTNTCSSFETAGPSHTLPTPPHTSPETITVLDSDDESDESSAENVNVQTNDVSSELSTEELRCQSDDQISDDQPEEGLVWQPQSSPNRSCDTSIRESLDEVAQCVCTLPNNDDMIQCSTCKRWYHYECVHLTAATLPTGDYFCHFEAKSTVKPYDNSGNRMNDLESRALFLTVKHFAPLGNKFWENVSEYMLTQFNITRSVTSVKMEWLRYSSAWFGFDERFCKQYREEDFAARKALYRSSQKDVKPPPLVWKWLGMPVDLTAHEQQKQRKPRNLAKSEKKPKKPKSLKRKRAVFIIDSDSEDDLPQPATKSTKKNVRAPPPPPTVGGKWVASEEIFVVAAPQTPSTLRALREAEIAHQPGKDVGSAAVNAAALAQPWKSQMAETAISAYELAITDAPSPVTEAANDASIRPLTSPSAFDGNILQSIYPDGGSIDHYYCSSDPAPPYESRFDALAAHRRHVKECLRGIESNLDWFEGPWPAGQSELLWTAGDNEQCASTDLFSFPVAELFPGINLPVDIGLETP